MNEIEVFNWKRYEKGFIRGFFSARLLPSQIIIHNLILFQKGGGRWIGLPSRKFTSIAGTRSYEPVVEIRDRTAADRFRDLVLAAIDKMNGGPE